MPIEVIVADDASTDDTAAWLAAHHPEVRLRPARAQRRLLRRGQRGHRRGPGRVHPAPQQRHRGDRRLDRGGPGAVRRPDGRLGRPAGPGPLRPAPGRLGRRFVRARRLADQARPRRGRRALARPPARARLRRQRIERLLPRLGACDGSAAFDPTFGSYYEDVDLAFRLRWAGYDVRLHARAAGSSTRSRPATTTPAPPSSGGCRATPRSCSGPTFPRAGSWPPPLPHLAFTLAQGLWRLARGRPGPFWLGKWDALRALPTLPARRTAPCRPGPAEHRHPPLPTPPRPPERGPQPPAAAAGDLGPGAEPARLRQGWVGFVRPTAPEGA